MRTRKISFVLNIVIFILEIGSMVWMMSGISVLLWRLNKPKKENTQ